MELVYASAWGEIYGYVTVFFETHLATEVL